MYPRKAVVTVRSSSRFKVRAEGASQPTGRGRTDATVGLLVGRSWKSAKVVEVLENL
jgi:hypothetical protein